MNNEVSSLDGEKGIKAAVVGPDSSETCVHELRGFVWQSSVHDSHIEEQNRSCIH